MKAAGFAAGGSGESAAGGSGSGSGSGSGRPLRCSDRSRGARAYKAALTFLGARRANGRRPGRKREGGRLVPLSSPRRTTFQLESDGGRRGPGSGSPGTSQKRGSPPTRLGARAEHFGSCATQAGALPASVPTGDCPPTRPAGGSQSHPAPWARWQKKRGRGTTESLGLRETQGLKRFQLTYVVILIHPCWRDGEPRAVRSSPRLPGS